MLCESEIELSKLLLAIIYDVTVIGASVAAIFGIFLFLTACLLLTYKAWIFHSKGTCIVRVVT